MRKIIACSVFNDKDSFKRHLSSLPKSDDVLHVVVDGRYKGFNYPSELSNDGTRELALSNPHTMLIDAPNLSEIEKRQIYFNMVSKGDVLIVVDSDEYLEGDWDGFCSELEEYNKLVMDNHPLCIGIYVFNPLHNGWDRRPRIWFNAFNVKMGPRHYEYTNSINKQPITFNYWVKLLKANHNYKYRYESYNVLREEYQNMLIANENHI